MPNNNDNNSNSPSISSVSYDASNGVLTLTGSNFSTSTQDYVITDLRFKGNGDGNNSYTLTVGSTITGTILSSSLSIQLSASDQSGIAKLFKNGNQDNNGHQIYFSAADNWDTGASGFEWRAITVNNLNTPSLSGVSYDAATGLLTLSGNNLTTSASDYQATNLSFTCNGSHYTITGGNVSGSPSSSAVSIQLSSTDQTQLDSFFKQNGNQDASGNPYQLVANAGWDNGASSSTQTVEVNSVKQSIASNVYADDIRVDGNNNTFYHDTNDNCIHKIDSQTNQETTAYKLANGEQCNSSVVSDDSGNLYFHSTGSSDGDCIKKIDAKDSHITVIAKFANGEQCNGDVVNDHNGNQYFHSTGSSDDNCIKKIDATDNHVSTIAKLANGEQCNGAIVSDDSNNLYFNSTGSSDGNCIKKIGATDNNVTTIAKFTSDVHCNNLVVDHNGNLYFNDSGNNCIKEIPANSNQVNTLVTGIQCNHLERDSDGNIYFNNSNDNTIKEISAGDHHVTTLATNINGGNFTIDNHGKLLINDSSNHEIKGCDTHSSTPSVNSVTASGNADSTLSISLSGNDTNGTLASFKVAGLPANGTLYTDVALTHAVTTSTTISATNNAATLYFKPNGDWNGNTSFQYNAIDDKGLQSASSATASITVNAVDADTTATAVSVSGNADSTLTLQLSGADTDGSIASFKVAGLPANGTLYTDAALTHAVTTSTTINATNNAATLYFKPNSDWYGNTSFQYNAIDDKGLQSASAATASITVNAVDADTTATAVSASGNADSTLTLQLSGADTDGSIASFKISATPANGTLYTDAALTHAVTTSSVISATNNAATLYFKPNGDWYGNTSFQYNAIDDKGLQSASSATASITVNAVDADTTATVVSVSGNADSTLTLQLSGADTDGSIASFKISATPANGTLYTDAALTHAVVTTSTVISATNNAATLYFKPSGDWYGNTSFQYNAIDDKGLQSASAATASITVNAVDADTTATAVSVSGNADSTLTLQLSGADTDGSIASFKVAGLPANGTLYTDAALTHAVTTSTTISATNNAATLYFKPNGDWYGNTSFQYNAIDDKGLQSASAATASITVNAVDADTTATAVSVSGNADSTLTLKLSGADTDGSIASFKVAGLPANGTLYTDAALTHAVTTSTTISATNNAVTLYFKPNGDWYGNTSFQYNAIDDKGLQSASAASASITVNAIDSGVTANTLSLNGTEDVPMRITLSGSDDDGSITSFKITSLCDHGTLYTNANMTRVVTTDTIIVANGNSATLYFRPANTWAGNTSFSYVAVDDQGLQSATAATGNITIAGPDDVPTANNITINATEDTVLTVTLSGQDIDGNIASFKVSNLPSIGNLYTDSSLQHAVQIGATISAVNNSATLYFKPSLEWNGSTSFQYVALDNDLEQTSAAATATINVSAANDGPSFSIGNGVSGFVKSGPAVVIDNTLQLHDADLALLDNYNGASLTLVRDGGASVQDVFSGSGNLSFSNGNVLVSGINIGTVSNVNGKLSINFNNNATQARVDDALASISYANNSFSPPDSVQIDYSFKEGNTALLNASASTSITMSIVSNKGLSGVNYDASTGKLTLNGTHLTSSAGDYHFIGSTLTGDRGATYTLTANDITLITPSYGSVTVQLSDTAKQALSGLFDQSGKVAFDGVTAYNLSLLSGWNTNASAISTEAVWVSNTSTSPSIAGINYDAATGYLTINGANLSTSASSYHANLLSIYEDESPSLTFSTASNQIVGNPTSRSVTFHLSANDQQALNSLIMRADSGEDSDSADPYTFSTGAGWTMRGTALTSHNIIVSNLPLPSVSTAAYNVTTGLLSLTGTNFSSLTADYQVTDLTLTGDGGTSYTLTKGSSIVGSPTATGVTVQLSAADQFALDGLFNKNGGQANDGQTAYRLSAAAGWDMNASLAASVAVTVSNADSNQPTLSGINYDAAKGIFTFTGSHLSNYGNNNGIDLTHFTITDSHGRQFNFSTNDAITLQTTNGFSVTLSSNEQAALTSFVNSNGVGNYTFSSTAKWDSDSGAAINNQAINVSGAATPTLSGVSYDASTGKLTLNGTHFTSSAGDYHFIGSTLTGDSGATYTLTANDITLITPSYGSVTVQLSDTAKQALSGLFDQSGKVAFDGVTAYNLSLLSGWDINAAAISTESVWVSNASTSPSIAGINYDAATGYLTINGANLSTSAASYHANRLSIYEDESPSLTFSTASNQIVGNPTSRSVTFHLSANDQQTLNSLILRADSGEDSDSADPYTFSTGAGWTMRGTALTSHNITVSNLPLPSVTTAAYNVTTGLLSLTGTNFSSLTADYQVTDLTLTGDGGTSYTLTKGSSIVGSPTATGVTVQLSAADQFALDGLFNKNGGQANDGQTAYRLSATAGWDMNASLAASVAVAVSNADTNQPILSGINYNAAKGIFTFTGSHLSNHGNSNGFDLTHFAITDGHGGQFNFNTNDVISQQTANGFTVTLTSNEQTALASLIKVNGNSAYNFSATAKWDSDSGAAISSQAINVTGLPIPTVSGVNYDVNNGLLTVNGLRFTTSANDYHINSFTFKGDGGSLYTLSNASVITGIQTASTFKIQLSTADQLALDGLFNKSGTVANDGTTTYNLSLAAGWDTNGSAVTTQSVFVSNAINNIPKLTGVSYQANTGIFTFTGSHLSAHGSDANSIALANFKLSVGSSSYTLDANNDTVSNLNASGFTVALSNADKATLNNLIDANGNYSSLGSAYSLAVSARWDSDNGAISNQTVNVSGVPAPVLTSVSYDGNTGQLTLIGNHLTTHAANYNLGNLTLTGDGNSTYTLSNSSVLGSPTTNTVVIQLSSNDRFALEGLLNNNGTLANDGTTLYRLSAAAGWDLGAAQSTQSVSVSNISAPTLSTVNYNATTGVFTLSGNHLTNHGNSAGINLTDFSLSAGSNHFNFGANDSLSQLGSNGFTITLNSTDKALVNAFIDSNGLTNTNGATYNLSTIDHWDSNIGSAISTQAVNVSGVPPVIPPTISGITYDVNTGLLTVNGNRFTTSTSDYHVGSFTFKGDGGSTYTLSNASIITQASVQSFVVQLSVADQFALDGLLNKSGTLANDNTLYNLSLNNGWDAKASAIPTHGVFVSNADINSPRLSAVSYHADTGILNFTGTHLTAHGNDVNSIALANFNLSVGSSSYTFNTNDLISNFNSSGFSVTLSASDKAILNGFIDANGNYSSLGSAYNLAVSTRWDSDSGVIANQKVIVSGVPAPVLTAVNYDGNTGLLTLTGNNLTTHAQNYPVNHFTLTGDGNNSYTLSNSSTIVGTPNAHSVVIQLSSNDRFALDGLFNKNGNLANDGNTTYNLSASAGWDFVGAAAITTQSVTVSNVSTPTLSTVNYNATTGVFTVTGTHLTNHGNSAGINLTDFTLSAGNNHFNFGAGDNLSQLSNNGFAITLSNADAALVSRFINNNGLIDGNGNAYNLAATANWDSDSGAAISTLAVNVSNLPIPTVSGVNYDVNTGLLTVNGNRFSSSASDYHVNNFTLKGDGGSRYTLTSGSTVSPISASSFTVQLSTADQLAVDGLLNKSGTIANEGVTTYNLSLAAGWDLNGLAVNTQGVFVSNATNNTPKLSGVSYQADTGTFSFTGSHIVAHGSDANSIALANIKLTAGNSSYIFNAANDTVSNLSSTGFNVTLNSSERATLAAFVDANGHVSSNGGTYGLAISALWDSDNGAANNQSLTVNGVPAPSITAVSYDSNTGQLTLNGNNFTTHAVNYHVNNLTLTGDGNNNYTLSNSSVIIGTPTTSSVVIQLSSSDRFALEGLLNNNGTLANDGSTTYGLSTAAGWDFTGATAISTQNLTVSNWTAPTLSTVNYNAATGVISVTGSHLTNHGNNTGINLAEFTLSAGSNHFNFGAGDTLSQLSSSGFSITLSNTDKASISSLLNSNGLNNGDGNAYNLSTTANWDSDSGQAITTQAINVSGLPIPAPSGISYDVNSGLLTVNGNRFSTSASDYHVNNFTFKGDGGSSYTLTSGSVISGTPSSNTFAIQLSAADQFALDGLLNKSGSVANDGTSYNVSLTAGWDINGLSISNQSLWVSNATANMPKLTGVSYQGDTGVFTFTGTHLSTHGNDANSLALANFKLTGGNGGSFSFNATHDTVSHLTSTGFTVTLSYADQTAVNAFVNANGNHPVSGSAYNITATANWDSNNGYAITQQGVNVSGEDIVQANTVFNTPLASITQPVAISALIENSGQLELSKAVFTAFAGAGASIDVSNFSNANHSTGVNDYLYYDASSGGLFYADQGSAAGSTVTEIAIIGGSQGHPSSLSAGDFSLIA